jgi:hypothetical protein
VAATQSTHFVDGAPWRIFQIKVPTNNKTLFTRAGDVAGADLKTYDMGALHVSTEACSSTSIHGYVEVEYDIEFFNKQSSTVDSFKPPVSYYYLSANQSVTASTAIEWTEAYNGLGSTNETPGVIVIPNGTYRITYLAQFTGGGTIATIGLQGNNIPLLTPTEAVSRTSGTYIVQECVFQFPVGANTTSDLRLWVSYTSGTVNFQAHECKIIIQKL